MKKKIIKIDEDKCIGCTKCINACKEGAIGLVNGKAKLLREEYCDGLGNCLPTCPTKAISFEEREITETSTKKEAVEPPLACGCPSTNTKKIERTITIEQNLSQPQKYVSQLNQWPIQIKLVPPNAPYFTNANLLIAADCCAYSFGNFHNDFMKKKITIIGCPKLDDVDYSEKLTHIIKENNIKSITITRMEVPCCSAIVNAVTTALKNSNKMIPWQIVIISTDGEILE